ncbi:MAG: V-type ATP synthase subunit D [Fastidiosipilaceae bacterium]|jgi:V/A-type H+-transporting ATPase subunit D
MARLNVSPTRMVLADLKRRRETAIRGHKLLKDKQDELMRRFIEKVRVNMKLRQEIERELSESFRDFMLASAVMSPEMLEQAVSFSKTELMVEIKEINSMSVIIPQMSFVRKSVVEEEADIDTTSLPYGYAQTSGDLDAAIERLEQVMDKLLRLAEVEKSCQLMADEIESTRRRVNALEYRTIPDLEETIKFIRMKLEENERATITRLLKVKEMISEQD